MSKLTDFISLFKWDTTDETDLSSAFNIETALNENWDKIDESLESLDSRATTNESSISTNATNIEANAESITELKNNVTTDEETIAGIKETIAEIQAEQTTQNENISTNESSITVNGNNIATNTDNIATNANNIATNTDNIATNTKNIATNTANIATNTANIEAIQEEQEEQNTKIDNREHKHTYYTYDVTEDISSGTTITLPCSYVVGADNLVLYDFFGHRLIKDEDYSEVGTTGAESTTITLLFDVVYSDEYEKKFDLVIKEVDV